VKNGLKLEFDHLGCIFCGSSEYDNGEKYGKLGRVFEDSSKRYQVAAHDLCLVSTLQKMKIISTKLLQIVKLGL